MLFGSMETRLVRIKRTGTAYAAHVVLGGSAKRPHGEKTRIEKQTIRKREDCKDQASYTSTTKNIDSTSRKQIPIGLPQRTVWTGSSCHDCLLNSDKYFSTF